MRSKSELEGEKEVGEAGGKEATVDEESTRPW